MKIAYRIGPKIDPWMIPNHFSLMYESIHLQIHKNIYSLAKSQSVIRHTYIFLADEQTILQLKKVNSQEKVQDCHQPQQEMS